MYINDDVKVFSKELENLKVRHSVNHEKIRTLVKDDVEFIFYIGRSVTTYKKYIKNSKCADGTISVSNLKHLLNKKR